MTVILLIGAIVLIIIAVYFLVQPSAQTIEGQEIKEASVKSSLNVQIGVGFLALVGIAAYLFYNPLPGHWTAVFPSDAAKNNTKVIRKLELSFEQNKIMTYSVSWMAEGGSVEPAPGGQTLFHSGQGSGETSFKGTYSVFMFRVYVSVPVNGAEPNVDYPPFTFDKVEKNLAGKLTMKLWAPVRLEGEQLIIEGGSPVKAIHFSKSTEGVDNPFVLEFHDGQRMISGTRKVEKSVSYEYVGPEHKSDLPQTNVISNEAR